MEKINEIINELVGQNIIKSNQIEVKSLKSGTTDGVLFTLFINKKPEYVVKIDQPSFITTTEQFLLTYKEVALLPKLIYTDKKKEFLVYTYFSGQTHNHRGSKLEWMTILIEELFNKYHKVDERNDWGRVNGAKRASWADFNLSSFEFAKQNMGDLLSNDEHERVELLIHKLKAYENQEKKYYLHGDAGVHNFVYENNKIKGVIDPSPLIGPKIYDFTYAFCSSPDKLNKSTLYSAISFLKDVSYSKERLVEEVLFQLYTRIGVCVNVHPHDLSGYMEAWKEWREYLPLK